MSLRDELDKIPQEKRLEQKKRQDEANKQKHCDDALYKLLLDALYHDCIIIPIKKSVSKGKRVLVNEQSILRSELHLKKIEENREYTYNAVDSSVYEYSYNPDVNYYLFYFKPLYTVGKIEGWSSTKYAFYLTNLGKRVISDLKTLAAKDDVKITAVKGAYRWRSGICGKDLNEKTAEIEQHFIRPADTGIASYYKEYDLLIEYSYAYTNTNTNTTKKVKTVYTDDLDVSSYITGDFEV